MCIRDRKKQADDFKQTLSVVHAALEQPEAAPTLSMRAAKKENGVEQAKAEIEAALRSFST